MKKRFLITMCLVAVLPLMAQYIPYYGKNKVIRKAFDWKVLESPHFQVYYYIDDLADVELVAQEAERAYARLSNFLGVTIKEKTPVIFYYRQTDIEQTNIFPGIIEPGMFEGFNEPIGHRLVIYGNRSKSDLARLIVHELTHSFEFEILYKGRTGSMFSVMQPPTWVMEGLAEFMTGDWRSFYEMTVIDYVVTDQLPELGEDGDFRGGGRAPYDLGHLIYDFIFEKLGKKGVQNTILSYRRPSLVGRRNSFLSAINYTPKQFNYEFRKYARERYRRFFNRENPEDYSIVVAPEHPYYYSLSHQVSPSGEILAALTFNTRSNDLDLVLFSLKEGRVIKNITPGIPTKYDTIWFNFDPADGQSFSWDKQARTIAFFARKGYKYSLLLLDVASGRTLRDIPIPDIEKPSSPRYHQDGEALYFTGVQGLNSDLYRIDLKSERIDRLTSGKTYFRSFDFSPDGQQIVYSALTGDYEKLFLAPVASPERAMQLTQGSFNDITPVFSPDGKTIYYSSDELDVFNACSIDLENRIHQRYTDVRTGAFFPVPIPGKPNEFIISTWHKSLFSIFRKTVTQVLDKREVSFGDPGAYFIPENPPEKGTSAFRLIEEEREFHLAQTDGGKGFKLSQKKYRPLEKIIVEALPTVSAGISTGGPFSGLDGAAYMNFTDLMNDYQLNVYFDSTYGYRSYQVTFLNQRRRLQSFAQGFYQSTPFYDYSYNLINLKQYGGIVGFHYPFSMYYRIESALSMFKYTYQVYDPYFYKWIPMEGYDFWAFPLSLSVVGETTRFNMSYMGPNSGHTFRLSARKFFKLNDKFLDSLVLTGEFRKYFRIDNNTLFATRLSGYYSGGNFKMIDWTGGYNTLRSTYYSGAVGNRGFYFNAEFRFPLIQAALTPLGVIGPIRGVVFFDAGGYWYHGKDFRVFQRDKFLKFADALSSYGFGFQVFAFGLPLHFEWVYHTTMKDEYEGKRFARFNFWIGLDF